ncbi:carbohydrate kinase, partial [Neoconidiobolus thromboides FSU 785]
KMAKTVILIMGVSGSGKSSIASKLSQHYNISYIEADDYHSDSNKQKMKLGHPLTDLDRQPWLLSLSEVLKTHPDDTVILACSALKNEYRNKLKKGVERFIIVYLDLKYETIYQRLMLRKNHFMGTKLLRSQFDTLEVPDKNKEEDVHIINIKAEDDIEDIVG